MREDSTMERHQRECRVPLESCAPIGRRRKGSLPYRNRRSGRCRIPRCPFLSRHCRRHGVAPSLGSNQAKDELTILGEHSAAGCCAVKAQRAGYLRLTASDRGRDCSLAQARLRSGPNRRYEHRARAFVQFMGFQRLGRESLFDRKDISKAINEHRRWSFHDEWLSQEVRTRVRAQRIHRPLHSEGAWPDSSFNAAARA